MSTSISVFQQDLPDFLKTAQADDLTKSLAGGGTTKRLSIRGGVFRMMVGGKEVRKSSARELQIVIVNAAPKVARTFYAGAYSAEAVTAPDCWSNDGVAPDEGVFAPQHSNCNDCPQNIQGSGQGSSRACRFSQRLAVQLVGDPTGDVYQLVLPSQSIFGKGEGDSMPFQQYVKLLVANGRSINTMVTEISFDTDSATPKLFFKPVAHVTKEQYDSAVAAGASEEAKRAVTMTVAQTDGVKKISGPTPTKAAAPVEAEAEGEESADEPKKRASKKPEVAEGKKNLADVMKEWN
jgi:hypothetical protein